MDAIMVGMKECNCDWARHWQKLAMRTMELERELWKANELIKRAQDRMNPDEIECFFGVEDHE
jgi:hypothetical protein